MINERPRVALSENSSPTEIPAREKAMQDIAPTVKLEQSLVVEESLLTKEEDIFLATQVLEESYRTYDRNTTGVEKKSYTLESGETIHLTSKEFTPKKSEFSEKESQQTVVFLPGWAMSGDSLAITGLGQAFAEQTGNATYAISSQTEGVPHSEESLYREAHAIAKFIKEKNLTEVTIAGHSQGGSKAIDLVSLLQNDPELRIQGLILIDSMGLYEQGAANLAGSFAKDSMVNTPITMVKKSISKPSVMKQGLQAANAVVAGIGRKLISGKLNAPTILKTEIQTMAQSNPRMKEVTVPTIIISGSEDPISHPDKIVSPDEEARIIATWEDEDDMTYKNSREEYLKQNQFPNSPYTRMIAPEKLGHHGLPFFRPESVANASLYLLKRAQRKTSVSQ
jgi:pimeloyl-ACP methyl ester carboxylesterase